MTGMRASIAPFAVHGGRIELARARFPGGAGWIDLSTGISPWAYSFSVDAGALLRLPEPGALAGLEQAAAAVFGSVPAETVAVPGSDLALRLVGQLAGARTPAVVGPGYSGHRAMWDDAAMLADVPETGHDAVVLARPNNPDGRMIDFDLLAGAARRLAALGGWLVVDEAFADAGDEASIASLGWPGTIVLRSFGKFFGLAGLRLGFVIAPAPMAAALRRLLGDWPVSGPAIAIGTAAYGDHAWQAAQRVRLADAAGRLDGLLTGAGLAVVGGTSCFRLVDTADAAGLFVRLAGHSILTRPFADDGRRLRIGLPVDEVAFARLGVALGR
ncbi:threonine-phosphate decarboxylase [Polymorphobacter glacialis]|uniref:Aminotransferase n=1 Tax=Sandarakinorhabdus glacialis TaxID=1614636 RepID=A0A916ZLH3_9SPHN|nr:aminotransferase class I/II-fold pyridoxal phosphate-dependent enzyme [Polymorphobacter glacialis]GGE03339.1 threonine-phosphate decarboxylase [Polymorphobacter glacialis]